MERERAQGQQGGREVRAAGGRALAGTLCKASSAPLTTLLSAGASMRAENWAAPLHKSGGEGGAGVKEEERGGKR